MIDQAQPSHLDLKSSRRYSYLLRLWRNGGAEGTDWRASLEVPETGKRIGFASLEELFAYLMDLTLGNEHYPGS